MADEWRPEIARLDGRINSVEATVKARVDQDDQKWADNRETHRDLYQRTERPSWLVTWVITALGSLAAALAVYAMTGG